MHWHIWIPQRKSSNAKYYGPYDHGHASCMLIIIYTHIIVKLSYGEYPGEKRSAYLDIFRLLLLRFGMNNNDMLLMLQVGVASWLPNKASAAWLLSSHKHYDPKPGRTNFIPLPVLASSACSGKIFVITFLKNIIIIIGFQCSPLL